MTAIPGTTRDLVAEQVDVEGLAVTLVDTAGWRETLDVVEREGVTRGEHAREVADLLVLVLDRSEPLKAEDEQLLTETSGRRRIVVANKSDLPAACDVADVGAGADGGAGQGANHSASQGADHSASQGADDSASRGANHGANDGADHGVAAGCFLSVSAKTGAGAGDLRRGIVTELTGSGSLRDTVAISNERHIMLVEQARASLVAAEQAVAAGGTPEEFVLADLQAARARLEEVVGARTSEDLLRHIFEKFCVGK